MLPRATCHYVFVSQRSIICLLSLGYSKKCYLWTVSFYCSSVFLWLHKHVHGQLWLIIWNLSIPAISAFSSQQMLELAKDIKGLKSGFPGHQVQISLTHSIVLDPIWEIRSPPLALCPPTQFKRRLKDPSDSLVKAGLEETTSMKSIWAALFSWMKMVFELRPFCETKLEGQMPVIWNMH